MKKTALISVSDKSKVENFAKELSGLDYSIIATGNTARMLRDCGIDVADISSITGSPEIFGGRVKTIHPKIFGGILLRRNNRDDLSEAEGIGIKPIDIVCVNLYPFEETSAKPDAAFDEIIENIDIGGPSLLRAAAKNHQYVSVLTDPNQYDSFLEELKSGEVTIDTRRKLAVEAFSHTSRYDTLIANYLEDKFKLPRKHFRINYLKEMDLRYGENPHQEASVYGSFKSCFEVFHGKEISYNNILDLISAVELIEELEKNSCVIVKHNNPAGAAAGNSLLDAYQKALATDPVSAFGGIVAFNSTVDADTAAKLNEIFLEIVCAPAYSEEALKILFKKKDRRLVKQLKRISIIDEQYRAIPGGVLFQKSDRLTLDRNNLNFVTAKKPEAKEIDDLIFAWIVAKHTKSNAIVFVKDKTTLGVGAGQMSRIDSVKIAKLKAEQFKLNLNGSAAASDAFFPFADGLLEIVKCGATSVIQPGGSIRDKEVIGAADEHNISMVFTGIRHFKH